ncbi:MAG TPA: hypothetical protein VMG81_07485 [Thermoplasmata archaeon]|nr:hypothetical protein [Thermoplasmata archaeon]
MKRTLGELLLFTSGILGVALLGLAVATYASTRLAHDSLISVDALLFLDLAFMASFLAGLVAV